MVLTIGVVDIAFETRASKNLFLDASINQGIHNSESRCRLKLKSLVTFTEPQKLR